MPSDKCNMIAAKGTGLICSLFGITSAQHVLFGIPQYVYNACILDLPLSSFVYHFFLLTAQGVDS